MTVYYKTMEFKKVGSGKMFNYMGEDYIKEQNKSDCKYRHNATFYGHPWRRCKWFEPDTIVEAFFARIP